MSKTELSPGLLKNPIHLLSFGFGAGYVPKMPGTIGTFVGVFIYLPMQLLEPLYYLFFVALLFVLGIWLCGKTASELGVHDHSAIVWDEIVGYLLTMTAAPSGWEWILLGFILFRLFDICKPWPIRRLDKGLKSGFGIMIDDVLAAGYGLLVMHSIAYLLIT